MSDSPTVEPGTDAAVEPSATEVAYGCPMVIDRGQQILFATIESYLETVRALLDDGYAMCVDLTAVDYLEFTARQLPAGVVAGRFEVVVNLLDITNRRRIRVRVQVPDAAANVPSLFDLFPGTEAMEREVFDMFGIAFSDHPDLTRILMPEDWVGHPLRKDYEVGSIPVQFKGAPS